MKKTCFDCRFFEKPSGVMGDNEGKCRINPPVVIPTGQYNTPKTVFPRPGHFDWCGKFEDNTETPR